MPERATVETFLAFVAGVIVGIFSTLLYPVLVR